MTNERILIMNQPNILILHLDELRQDCLDTQHRRSGSRRRNLSEPLYGLSGLYPIPLFAI